MSSRRIALLGVPSSAGTHGPGQELAPQHLRAAGLVERLRERGRIVTDLGDLPVVRFQPDPAGRNRQSLRRVAAVAEAVAERVETIVADDALPVILGGDCTITLGVLAGYLRAGIDIGLLYFDGDIDLSTPDTTVSGILDTMGMAHLLGDGDPDLSRIGPRYPLMPPDRVVAFGYDRVEVTDVAEAALARHGITAYAANDMSRPAEQAAEAWAALTASTDRILLHFDIDVIDSTDLPLADFPHFNEGLSEADAMTCLRVFGGRPELAGLVVTEVNPHRDPDGALIHRLVDGLVTAIAA